MKRLSYFLRDKNKKSVPRIIYELIYLWIKKREVPVHYFTKYLYRKEINNIDDYLTTGQVSKISFSGRFNKPEYSVFLSSKLLMALLCEKQALSHPKLYFYNFGHRFFVDEETFVVNNRESLVKTFNNIFKKFGIDSLFLKPLTLYGGEGCFLISKENLYEQYPEIERHIFETNYIGQEIIEQHAIINEINPTCINSLRMETYIDARGTPHILSALMRFGKGDSVVDNASSGGFYVGVDMNTGKLKKTGQQLLRYGGKQFFRHPFTQVEFGNREIPFFKEACDLVLGMVNNIPDRLVGWDIAITPNGPILIEGNIQPGLLLTDVAYGGLLKHPVLKEIIAEIGGNG